MTNLILACEKLEGLHEEIQDYYLNGMVVPEYLIDSFNKQSALVHLLTIEQAQKERGKNEK